MSSLKLGFGDVSGLIATLPRPHPRFRVRKRKAPNANQGPALLDDQKVFLRHLAQALVTRRATPPVPGNLQRQIKRAGSLSRWIGNFEPRRQYYYSQLLILMV